MIILEASFDYVMRVDTFVKTETAQKPQPLEMVYDTGAGTTTISRKFALDSGYKLKKGKEPIDGLGGRVVPDYTVIPNLIIGGVSLGPVYAHVVEFHKELQQKTSAVLGMNVLSWFKITQECHWHTGFMRYASATLLLEPKYDVHDKVDLERFSPLDRGQRFGVVFLSDRTDKNEKLNTADSQISLQKR